MKIWVVVCVCVCLHTYVVGTVGVLERVEICVGVKKSGCGTGTRDTADSGRRVTLISVTSVSLADACRFSFLQTELREREHMKRTPAQRTHETHASASTAAVHAAQAAR